MIILNKQLWFQITIFKTNNLQLYGIKYSYLIQIICKQTYLAIDGTLTGATNLSQSRPGSNENERVFDVPQRFRTGASTSDIA